MKGVPMVNQEIDRLADAVSSLAEARNRIPVERLLNEIAINILVLARIAAGKTGDVQQRDTIDTATDRLVGLLRRSAREAGKSP
jgi:hypothetical protein